MSLRGRLILAAAYILTVVVIALEVPLAITIAREEHQAIESTIVTYTEIVASAINDDVAALAKANEALPNPGRAVAQVAEFAAAKSGARIVVVGADGRVLYDTTREAPVGSLFATSARPEFAAILSQGQGTLPDVRTRDSETAGEPLLLVTAPVIHNRQVIGAVRASYPMPQVNATIYRSWLGFGAIGLAVIVVGMILAGFLARSIARPVERLERTAEDLGRGQLGARAPVEGPEEIASLGESFNRMADALEANLGAQRDFVANASHQLRTPMTGIRLRLEAIEGEGGSAAEQASKAQAELARLGSLVDDLLALAGASSAGAVGARVDLVEVVHEAADRWADTARARGRSLTVRRSEPAVAIADAGDLGHVLDNLIENAIHYSPPGGHITVEASSSAAGPTLAVANDGPPVPSDERERIFDRFYRGTTGLSSGPGTGLGLAIVSELVRRWGGEVRLTDAPGPERTRFEASFPPAPASLRTPATRPPTPPLEPATLAPPTDP
jgi:signal transduction histidine kinase